VADLSGFAPEPVEGPVAQGAAVSGNPLLLGGEARTTNPTAVADGQVVRGMRDKLGRLVVVQSHVRDLVQQDAPVTLTTTTETTIIAQAAGVFHDLTAIIIANTSGTAVRVDIRDATAGTVRIPFYVPAGQTVGAVFSTPFKQATANNNWTAQLSGAVTDVRISTQAVKNI